MRGQNKACSPITPDRSVQAQISQAPRQILEAMIKPHLLPDTGGGLSSLVISTKPSPAKLRQLTCSAALYGHLVTAP
jgi:hypothetical protein